MVYDPTNIYTLDELQSVTSSAGIIDCDIVIRGEKLRALIDVVKF